MTDSYFDLNSLPKCTCRPDARPESGEHLEDCPDFKPKSPDEHFADLVQHMIDAGSEDIYENVRNRWADPTHESTYPKTEALIRTIWQDAFDEGYEQGAGR